MVKSLDEQIKSLQERQAQLKARENDLMARRRERERRARTKRLIEVGAMAESAAGFEGGDERAKERIARLVQLGSLVEAMCSTDVMDNYTSREDLKTTVTKALEHNVRTSDGMNWNLHDLVYEALSEEWGRRDGEISDLWADDGPSGYQPPSYELDMLKAHAAELRAWASDAGVRLPSAESAGELREQVRDLPQEPQIQEQPGYGYQPGFQQPQQWQQQPWN